LKVETCDEIKKNKRFYLERDANGIGYYRHTTSVGASSIYASYIQNKGTGSKNTAEVHCQSADPVPLPEFQIHNGIQ